MKKYIFIKLEDKYFAIQTGDFANKELLQLNEVGYEVLSLIQNGKKDNEIIQLYQERFPDVPQVKDDIKSFCEQLRTICKRSKLDNENEKTEEKKVTKNVYTMIQEKYLELNKPFKVFLELTYNCNLRCPHCYIQEDINTGEAFVKKEKVFRLIDQLEQSGIVELNITGGECSLHPDFIEIVHYATSKNMRVAVLTNGQQIAQNNLVNELLDCPLDDVRVSIYGTEQYHNQFVQIPNAFQKSIKTLQAFREAKGIGTAAYVITNENIHYLDDLKKQLSLLKIPVNVSPIIMPTTYGDTSPTRYRLNRVDLKKVIMQNHISLTGASCSAGITRFRIRPNGEVNPCEMLRHVVLGNVYETSFEEVMEGELRQNWVKEFRKVLEEHSCNQCNLRSRCNMCPGMFYTENGSYDKPSPFMCVYAGVRDEISREL